MSALGETDATLQDPETVLRNLESDVAEQIRRVSAEERDELLQAVGARAHELLPSHHDSVLDSISGML